MLMKSTQEGHGLTGASPVDPPLYQSCISDSVDLYEVGPLRSKLVQICFVLFSLVEVIHSPVCFLRLPDFEVINKSERKCL